VTAPCLTPKTTLLVKLGSIAIHVEEMVEEDFKNIKFDMPAVKSALYDPEVKAWLADMDKLALLPAKRSERGRRK
jgi:hypothetical protein